MREFTSGRAGRAGPADAITSGASPGAHRILAASLEEKLKTLVRGLYEIRGLTARAGIMTLRQVLPYVFWVRMVRPSVATSGRAVEAKGGRAIRKKPGHGLHARLIGPAEPAFMALVCQASWRHQPEETWLRPWSPTGPIAKKNGIPPDPEKRRIAPGRSDGRRAPGRPGLGIRQFFSVSHSASPPLRAVTLPGRMSVTIRLGRKGPAIRALSGTGRIAAEEQ